MTRPSHPRAAAAPSPATPSPATPSPATPGATPAGARPADEPPLPHERDQRSNGATPPNSDQDQIGQQAHDDVARGLVDTDRGPVIEETDRRLHGRR